MTQTRSKFSLGRVPLERALSKLGLCTRTEARDLILSGKVSVHGVIEKSPLKMVNPNKAHIVVEGQKAKKQESRLIAFHKPKGVLTTKRDPEGRKIIYDLLPEDLQSFHAVGRLDQHTTGLLLLTNDTKLSNFLTDPKNEIERVYVCVVNGRATPELESEMVKGVLDQGERLRAQVAQVLKASAKESTLKLVLTQGKNREVRRLCEAFGLSVIKLKRIQYGPYELLDLVPGGWRELEIKLKPWK